MRRPQALVVAVVASLSLLASACGGSAPATTQDDQLRVVATTTVLGELTQRIVGAQGTVELLMQPGQDPHDFRATPQQIQAIESADLVIANGLGLEASLGDVLAANGDAVLEVAPMLDPLAFEGQGHGHEDEGEHEEEGDHEEEDDHDDDVEDPHVWLDPVRWADAARAIAKAVEAAGAPSPPEGWEARGEAVAGEVEAVRGLVEKELVDVPASCRKLVTNHDAFGYFAARFDFEVIGTVLPGASTSAEPSAKEFAELADLLRDTGVRAIFAENIQSTRLAESLAAEVGQDVRVVELLSDALSDADGAGGSYSAMMTTNAQRIAEALTPC